MFKSSPQNPPPLRPKEEWGLIYHEDVEDEGQPVKISPQSSRSTTNLPNLERHPSLMSKSWSVAAGLATPWQWAPRDQSRHSLYATLPFTSIMGLQTMERAVVKDLAERDESVCDEDMRDELDADRTTFSLPLIVAVFVAMTAEFLVGYNTSVMNGCSDDVFPGHTAFMWSWCVSIFAIGGPIGAALAGYMANRQGRRMALIVDTWIYLIGGLIQTFAVNIWWIIPGRFIIGIAGGFACVLVPIYLGELAPPTLRGTLGTCTQLSLVVGILVSDLLTFPLSNPKLWRYLFGVTPMLCIIMLALSAWLIESPRWLLSHRQNKDQAKKVLKQIRGFRSQDAVEKEIEHIIYADQIHRTRHGSAHGVGAIVDIFTSKTLRIFVITAIFLQMVQQLNGINAVFYYSTSIFKGMISNPQLGTCIVALINVLATYLALILMDSTPRRTLLFWSSGGMLVSALILMFSLAGYMTEGWSLFSIMTYVGFFEIGLGPIPWLIVTEMFDSKYVATVMAISCQVNWTCNFLVGISYPLLAAELGPWSFIPFAVVLILTIAFVLFVMPETYGEQHKIIYDSKLTTSKSKNNMKKQLDDINNKLAQMELQLDEDEDEEDDDEDDSTVLLINNSKNDKKKYKKKSKKNKNRNKSKDKNRVDQEKWPLPFTPSSKQGYGSIN